MYPVDDVVGAIGVVVVVEEEQRLRKQQHTPGARDLGIIR